MPVTKTHYYFDMMRKYIVGFYAIMSNYKIHRTDKDGSIVREIVVPVTYAGKSKLFYMLQHNDNTSQVNMVLPRIGFIVTDMRPDNARRTNPTNTENFTDSTGTKQTFSYSGAPYNISVSCSVIAKNMNDMLQIVEQIVPRFTPDYNLTIKEIPELGVSRDVSINLDSVNFAIDTEFGEDEDRLLVADLEFTIKGMFYRPLEDLKLIEEVIMKQTPSTVNEDTEISQLERIDEEDSNET